MENDNGLMFEPKGRFLQACQHILHYNGIFETKKDRIANYTTTEVQICHSGAMAYGNDFGFLTGAKMEDKLGLIAIRVSSQKDLDLSMVEYCLNRAF